MTAQAADTVALFLDGIYCMARDGQHQEGSVTIIGYIDDLLHSNNTATCNSVLDAVQVKQLPARMILAFLTATRLLPDQLITAKPRFILRARDRLAHLVGVERAELLLK